MKCHFGHSICTRLLSSICKKLVSGTRGMVSSMLGTASVYMCLNSRKQVDHEMLESVNLSHAMHVSASH